MSNNTNALEIVGLRAGYDASDVLLGMSLHVGPRERVGLFGPNGHGKTTLLNTISRVIRPRAGDVRFMGEPIDQLAPQKIVARGLIHVPQANRLFPDMQIMETLELAAFTPRAREGAENKSRLCAQAVSPACRAPSAAMQDAVRRRAPDAVNRRRAHVRASHADAG
ncbi:ATP-binding cassette domain-containing protein [Bradyrhizobium sp. JR3.5]